MITPQPQYPEGVEARLAQLGLAVADFHFALRAAEAERRMCTTFDPPVMPGWTLWGKGIGALRERLVDRGWTMDNPYNVPRVIHPSGDFAIIVNTGDVGTGILALPVKTKHPRGLRSREAVEANTGQLSLLTGLNGEGPEYDQTSELLTWIFLVRAEGEVIRCELSLPAEIDDSGHITAWAERIPLPPLDVDDDGLLFGGGQSDDGPDFDVPVTRR